LYGIIETKNRKKSRILQKHEEETFVQHVTNCKQSSILYHTHTIEFEDCQDWGFGAYDNLYMFYIYVFGHTKRVKMVVHAIWKSLLNFYIFKGKKILKLIIERCEFKATMELCS
jgi:hypothetical protein